MTTRTAPEAPATTAGALGSSPYGLTRREIRTEIRRIAAAGFQTWEIRKLFGHPRTWGPPWS